jgi:hypothetical protein
MGSEVTTKETGNCYKNLLSTKIRNAGRSNFVRSNDKRGRDEA